MSKRSLIRFRPEGPGRPRQARAAWLHWPALAFRVRARVPPRRLLDVLEELVLRLAVAGYRSVDDVTMLSALAPELVEVVIGQLAHRRFLDANGATERGLAILDENVAADDAEVSLGWMLRCQLSGEVMPLFCDGDLPPVYMPHGTFPAFSPEPLVSRVAPEPLREFHIALSRWRELLRSADEGDRSDEEYDTRAFPLDADEADPCEGRVERPAVPGSRLPQDEPRLAVEVLDKAPHLVAVRTLVYLPQDPHLGSRDAEGLLIRHPLGIPGGEWFLRRFAASLPQMGSAGNAIRRWARSSRDHRERKLTAAGITIADLAPLGQQKILNLVGEVEPLHPPLREPLALVGESLVLVAKRPDRSDELRARISTLLEIVLDEWIRRFGEHREPPAAWGGGGGAGGIRRDQHIRAAAARLGVADVPKGFLGCDPAGLERAARGNGDLRDRMVLVLLDAATAPRGRHPLTFALREEPGLIEHLDFLRRTRNKSIHYRRGQQRPASDGAVTAEIIDRVERMLRALFNAWREVVQPAEETLELDL
jgi:hypothetical protein